jgi:hypothetical protein
MTTKTIAPRIWESWKIVSQPTTTTGQIRQDKAGRLWEGKGLIQDIWPKRGKPLVEVQELISAQEAP